MGNKLFILFIFLLFYGFCVLENNYYFADGEMWKKIDEINKTSNDYVSVEVPPLSQKGFCKEYLLKNVSGNVTNYNSFLFKLTKKNENIYTVCLNIKNFLIIIFLTIAFFALNYLIARLVYLKFKENKEKYILFMYFLPIVSFVIIVFLIILFYADVISFFVENPYIFIILFFIILNGFYLIMVYLINLAVETENPLKATILTFLVSMLPIEAIIILFNLILSFAESIGIFGFIFAFILIQFLLAEFYNKFVILLSTKLQSKELKRYEKEKEIKEKFSKYCNIGNVYIIDSPVANAFAVGLFKKDIYLTSKLMENFDEKEIKAIIAHEVGHHYHNHLFKLFCLIVGLYLLIYLLPLPQILKSLFYFAYVIFVFFGLGIIQNRFEYEADEFAAKTVDPMATISALEKLAELNKVPKRTGKIFNILFKHPSIEERIENIKKKFNLLLQLEA